MSATLESLMQHRDYKKMQRAATAYVDGMDIGQVMSFLDAAATKALYSGDATAAYAIRGVLNGPQAYGEYLKSYTVSLISDHPEYLKHFTSAFTSGLANHLN